MPTSNIVVFVDFIFMPLAVTQAKSALLKLISASLAEIGCIQYELCLDPGNSNHFILIERWENKAYWDAHLEKTHVREFLQVAKKLMQESFKVTWYYLDK
jgi:quinol monooxygenase YgiN